MKNELVATLQKRGLYEAVDLGPHTIDSVDYPDYATRVTSAIISKDATLGVLVCGTGIGMSMSANKVKGIRAALCHTEFEARMCRMHNDANVLCLGQRVIGGGVAIELVNAFLSTAFEGGRHSRRVEKMNALENDR